MVFDREFNVQVAVNGNHEYQSFVRVQYPNMIAKRTLLLIVSLLCLIPFLGGIMAFVFSYFYMKYVLHGRIRETELKNEVHKYVYKTSSDAYSLLGTSLFSVIWLGVVVVVFALARLGEDTALTLGLGTIVSLFLSAVCLVFAYWVYTKEKDIAKKEAREDFERFFKNSEQVLSFRNKVKAEFVGEDSPNLERAPVKSIQVKCSKCKALNDEDSEFCKKCGKKL